MRLHGLTMLFMLVAAGVFGIEPASITFAPKLNLGDQERIVLDRYIRHATAYAVELTQEKVKQRCAESPESFAFY